MNLFVYGEHLFFLKRDENYSNLFKLYRTDLDGKNELEFLQNGKKALFYKNKIYYNDGSGNLYRIDLDNTNLRVLLSGVAETFTVSLDKIIFIDFEGNINAATIDGKEITKIRDKGDFDITALNTHENRIFFTEYDEKNFDYSKYGWDYTVKSIDFEGGDEQEIISGTSNGMYTNLVGGRLLIFEYLRSGDILAGYIKACPASGGAALTLDR